MPVPSRSKNAKAGPGPSTKRIKAKKKKELPTRGRTRRDEDTTLLKELEDAVNSFEASPELSAFSDLPISNLTKKGLKKSFFNEMTDIQARSIPVSLKGRDILGAARTGSGKTLAFLIPMLEILYRARWGPQDGLGALILSPTRELAIQIFDVLRAIGCFHSYSAGLVIGGKGLKDEIARLSRMNILVATPGRLLQHMDQTVGFDCDHLQILILDEADRILDMGFAKSLNAIVSHLPKSRQTLLFSATQTESVKDLARLSLRDPVTISVREEAHDSFTPKNLSQHYLVCTLDKKLDLLFSFIRTHLQVKALVFFSSCKQVQYVFETFCKLRPGTSLLHLHGKQKQARRLDVYQRFASMKHAYLLATDVASRGLDFPAVDWVIQVDCPEDPETYIHRVGRTARYDSKGQGLLFLIPSEEGGMVKALAAKGIKPERIKPRDSKMTSIQEKLQNFAFQSHELKYMGQKAFVNYVRSVHLHKNKDVFKVSELPLDAFAASLGLPGAPKVKFAKAAAPGSKPKAKSSNKHVKFDNESDSSGDDENSESSSSVPSEREDEEDVDSQAKSKPAARTKYDRMFQRKNQDVLSEHYTKLVDHEESGEDDHILGPAGDQEDFITLKRADHELPEELQKDMSLIEAENMSKRKQRRANSKGSLAGVGPKFAKKVIFDEDGEAHDAYAMVDDEEFRKGDVKEAVRQFAETQREKLKDADVVDKQILKEKKKEKKRKRKERESAARENADGPMAVLEPPDENDGYMSPEFELSGSSADEHPRPPFKRPRTAITSNSTDLPKANNSNRFTADEELALKLLGEGG